MTRKISIAQIKPKLMDVEKNLNVMLDRIKRASTDGSKLIVFPELSLTGYLLKETDLNKDLAEKIDNSISILNKRSKELKVDLIMSYPLIKEGVNYVASSYLSNGITRSVHHKMYLANYGHCDEGRLYTPGESINVITTEVGKVAMLICEDGWHITNSIIAAQMGAELIIISSATSITEKKDIEDMKYKWETITAALGLSQTCYIIYCNRVGVEDNLTFWGGSHVVSPEGKIIKRLPTLKEEIGQVNIDLNYLKKYRESFPLLKNEHNYINLRHFKNIVQK